MQYALWDLREIMQNDVLHDSNSHTEIHHSTIESYFGRSQAPIQLSVEKGIVDVIIGELLLQDDNANEETSTEHALGIFKDALDASNADGSDAAHVTTARSRSRLRNLARFCLIVDYFCKETSFLTVLRNLKMMEEHTGLASLDSLSVGKAASYAHNVCVFSLQSLQNLLVCVWIFSIAVNISTHTVILHPDLGPRRH